MTPTAWVLLAAGVLLGLVIGSFTNVVIDRLPVALDEPNEYGDLYDTRPWREVVGGTSRCSMCGAPVRPVDNIPLVSYLVRRGRCRDCGEAYGAFHLAVELAVPAVGALLVWAVLAQDRPAWTLLPFLALVPAAVAVTVIDVRTLIVPTVLVWPTLAVTATLSAVAALVEGQPRWLLGGVVGVAVLAGPLFALWWILPSHMGFGDVRLATLLGWNVGFAATSAGFGAGQAAMLAVITLFLSAVLGMVVGVPAMVMARGRGEALMKARVPWGPALVAAALGAIALAGPILDPFR